jgi:Arc/MetJ-type ribon-helix-helix transcriptional regulator
MAAAKIAVSLDPEALKEADRWVQAGLFPSRSRLIQDALAEKLGKMRRVRLARECAKLDAAVEQAAAEEFLPGETSWPEY